MGRIDIFYGLGISGLAALFFVVTLAMPLRGAGFDRNYPLFVTSATFVLGLLLAVQGILALGRSPKAQARTDAPSSNLIGPTGGKLALLVLGGFVYILTVEIAGYIVVTPFLIGLTAYLFQERKWYRILILSVVTTVLLYFLFRGVFRVPLPRSILW